MKKEKEKVNFKIFLGGSCRSDGDYCGSTMKFNEENRIGINYDRAKIFL